MEGENGNVLAQLSMHSRPDVLRRFIAKVFGLLLTICQILWNVLEVLLSRSNHIGKKGEGPADRFSCLQGGAGD